MSRKTLILRLILVVLAVMLIMVTPVAAIVWGEPDGNEHPYVGMVLFYDKDGNFTQRCSGTLLSPNIFLTAGHCTAYATRAKVLFNTDLSQLEYPYVTCGPYTCYEGVPYSHPDFGEFSPLPFANNYDVGVVVFDSPVDGVPHAELAEIGEMDKYEQTKSPTLTIVGYGIQEIVPNPNEQTADRIRYQADPMLINIFKWQIVLSGNKGKNKGGGCFGDSGGPAFAPNSDNVIVAVTSWGNDNCVGKGYWYRMDTPLAHEFINSFQP